jgi:D-alanine-D-alanine ligase
VAEPPQDRDDPRRLEQLEQALLSKADEVAVFLVYDRPSLVAERPGLARTFFAERCASADQLQEMRAALHDVGIQAEVFEGDHAFLSALATGHHKRIGKTFQVAYNGLGYSVGEGAFRRGRKSLIPLIADSYGLLCANSDAYACALAMHKFHSFTLLRALGVQVPRTWQYRLGSGWITDSPPSGTKVIAKSAYESWAVGVTDASVFIAEPTSTVRLAQIAEMIGQDVTVQEFIAGPEVYVPVLSCPQLVACPPVEVILKRSPEQADSFITIDDNLRNGAISYQRFIGDAHTEARLRDSARSIFGLLELEGFGRIDFRIDTGGNPWVFDVAISPGLEAEGSGHKSLAGFGFDYPRFIRLVIAASLASQGLLSG